MPTGPFGSHVGGVGGTLAILAALMPHTGCVPECLFVDQSEGEVSLVVASNGDVSVVPGSFPEGAWICGGLVLPPGPLERRPQRRPHRPIPPGDWALDALADAHSGNVEPHGSSSKATRIGDRDLGRDTEEETW